MWCSGIPSEIVSVTQRISEVDLSQGLGMSIFTKKCPIFFRIFKSPQKDSKRSWNCWKSKVEIISVRYHAVEVSITRSELRGRAVWKKIGQDWHSKHGDQLLSSIEDMIGIWCQIRITTCFFSNGPSSELRSSYRNFRCMISNGNNLYFRFPTVSGPFGSTLRRFENSEKMGHFFCKNWHIQTLNFRDPLYSSFRL